MSQTSSSLTRQTGDQQNITGENYQNRPVTITSIDFSLKNKLLFECLFCKATFAKIVSYLKHISKHDMKQIHKCTICKKIVVEDSHFRDHLLEKHREFVVDIRVEGGKKKSKSEINNNSAQKANTVEMDNHFYHQLPYSYYQQFPQIATPILSNYIPTIPQAQNNNNNNSNATMGMTLMFMFKFLFTSIIIIIIMIYFCVCTYVNAATNKPPQQTQPQPQQSQQHTHNTQSAGYLNLKREINESSQFKCHDCDEMLSSLGE